MELDNFVEAYFHRGHRYKMILLYLMNYNGIRISLNTLKRILQRLGLRRNGVGVDDAHNGFRTAVENIQIVSGKKGGYRRTWHVLNRQYKLRSTQETVRKFLLTLDTAAVKRRIKGALIRRSYVSAGPNFLWHIDGYDKLKRFGFPIHACIDGFSRRILWLTCSSSNNSPHVVLHHYLSTVKQLGLCPTFVRSDNGSETSLVAAAQRTLTGDRKSHIFGPSPRNQRIESWWSYRRKGFTQIWLDVFDTLVNMNQFDPTNSSHIFLSRYCFTDVIMQELRQFLQWWNGHHIRQSATSGCPGGRPDEPYEVPEASSFKDNHYTVPAGTIDILLCEASPPPPLNTELINICDKLKFLYGWSTPCDRDSAVELYIRLVGLLSN